MAKTRKLIPCRREDSHQLLKWLEWLAEIELDVHFVDLFEVGSEGGKMIRIVPLPRWCLGNPRKQTRVRSGESTTHSLIIVLQHPDHPLHIGFCQPV
jgi:hypothetical protein